SYPTAVSITPVSSLKRVSTPQKHPAPNVAFSIATNYSFADPLDARRMGLSSSPPVNSSSILCLGRYPRQVKGHGKNEGRRWLRNDAAQSSIYCNLRGLVRSPRKL